jgi:predicted nucleotidyltransferase component of viral defense system
MPGENGYCALFEGVVGAMTPKKTITNVPASVRERLLNVAKREGRDYNALLRQYFQERFLYRLSVSAFKQNLILKGAFLFLTFDMPRTRPTKDIDFLGINMSNDAENIKRIVREILNIEAEDGVSFVGESVEAERITEGNEYHGLRVRFIATMGTIRRSMQIDIGFGDRVEPPPSRIAFPTLLDMPAPSVWAYHVEAIIAEKFEAIVKRQKQNSRMKDFYDIYYLATNSSFRLLKLRAALENTFQHRQTDAEGREVIFSKEFRTDGLRKRQWEAFLNRNGLEEGLTFERVISVLEIFINPLFQDAQKDLVWVPGEMEWIEGSERESIIG